MLLDDVYMALKAAGLEPRGAFHPGPDDAVPPMESGEAVRTLVLAGNAGGDMWAAFSRARGTAADPLDEWSANVLTALARTLGAAAYFPFTRPYVPFQRWARRAEPCHVSPLGILVHSDYGLWHGYRGALGFAQRLDLPPPDERESPCSTCMDKPCLGTCPVGAFDDTGYDVSACVAHLETSAGRDCLELGCRARRACPIGRSYVYEPAQANFHMSAFLRKHSRTGNTSNDVAGKTYM